MKKRAIFLICISILFFINFISCQNIYNLSASSTLWTYSSSGGVFRLSNLYFPENETNLSKSFWVNVSYPGQKNGHLIVYMEIFDNDLYLITRVSGSNPPYYLYKFNSFNNSFALLNEFNPADSSPGDCSLPPFFSTRNTFCYKDSYICLSTNCYNKENNTFFSAGWMSCSAYDNILGFGNDGDNFYYLYQNSICGCSNQGTRIVYTDGSNLLNKFVTKSDILEAFNYSREEQNVTCCHYYNDEVEGECFIFSNSSSCGSTFGCTWNPSFYGECSGDGDCYSLGDQISCESANCTWNTYDESYCSGTYITTEESFSWSNIEDCTGQYNTPLNQDTCGETYQCTQDLRDFIYSDDWAAAFFGNILGGSDPVHGELSSGKGTLLSYAYFNGGNYLLEHSSSGLAEIKYVLPSQVSSIYSGPNETYYVPLNVSAGIVNGNLVFGAENLPYTVEDKRNHYYSGVWFSTGNNSSRLAIVNVGGISYFSPISSDSVLGVRTDEQYCANDYDVCFGAIGDTSLVGYCLNGSCLRDLPWVKIIFPLNSTYENSTQLLNVVSTGNFTWYNWNGTNVSYINSSYVNFGEYGEKVIYAWTNDSEGNINYTNVTFTISPSCSESIVFSSWSEWENISECLITDQINQSRYRIEYDANACGTFENVTYYEYQLAECNYCSYSTTNTSWSEWVNYECSSNQMQQQRNLTEYDSNYASCYAVTGLSSDYWTNVTYYDYQLNGNSWINTSWSEWSDLDCINDTTRNQSRYLIEYDSNECGSNTTFYEYRAILDSSCSSGGGGSSTCTENWNCGEWSECLGGEQTRICTDLNNCGTTKNKPETLYSCGVIICNENWVCDWTICSEGDDYSYPINCYDTNNCGTFLNKLNETKCNSTFTNLTECVSNWQCSEWSECDADYSFENLNSSDFNSISVRNCVDLNKCSVDRNEQKNCVIYSPISIVPTSKNSIEIKSGDFVGKISVRDSDIFGLDIALDYSEISEEENYVLQKVSNFPFYASIICWISFFVLLGFWFRNEAKINGFTPKNILSFLFNYFWVSGEEAEELEKNIWKKFNVEEVKAREGIISNLKRLASSDEEIEFVKRK